MKLRKVLPLVLAMVMVVSLLAGCNTSSKYADVKVGMVTDTGGLGDESFNDSAWDGLEKIEKESKGKVKVSVLESEKHDDYVNNLSSMVNSGMDVTMAIGFLMAEALTDAAKTNSQAKFAIIDEKIDLPNVASATFREHEGSFLVGIIAGLTTKTNKIGFIGGMKYPLIEKFEYGFRAGVKAVNPNAVVFVDYADSFGDTEKGKELGILQNQKGADIIYHAAGGVGIGLIAAAEEKGFWAIGVDKDQSDLAPKNVLCSMIKRVDNATYYVAKAVAEGTFAPKHYEYGLKEEGVGYSDKAGNLSKDAKNAADKWKKAIIDGKLTVPSTEAEFNAFVAPKI